MRRHSAARMVDAMGPRSVPDADFDAIVIGLGVVGASVARELALAGHRVLALDAAQGIGGGCSYANAALLAPRHVTPLATPALLREAPRQMVRRPPAVRISPDPSLAPWLGRLAVSAMHAATPTKRLRRLAERSTEAHVALAGQNLSPTLCKTGAIDVYLREPRKMVGRLLSDGRMLEFEPSLVGVVGGTYQEDEWTLESQSYVRAMLGDAQRLGAEVSFDARVDRILTCHGQAVGVDTPSGPVRARHIVLAAGLHARRLAATIEVELPIRGGRGHVVDLVVPTEARPKLPIRIKEHRVVITPLSDRVRISGSIEFGREDRPVDPARGDALWAVAARVLPSLAGCEVMDRWSGERPCTSDGLPIIGPVTSVPGLHVAAGHGMWGMILAPATAQIVAAGIAHGHAAGAEWVSPDRYQ